MKPTQCGACVETYLWVWEEIERLLVCAIRLLQIVLHEVAVA